MHMSTTQQTVENATTEDRLYTVKYDDPGESHLDIHVPGFCSDRCPEQACIDVCPADVWRPSESGVPVIAYENCLECGSCRWACPLDNVDWSYPERGSGVTYKRG